MNILYVLVKSMGVLFEIICTFSSFFIIFLIFVSGNK